ncbi:MAG TPA: hypothetical protein VD837_16580 [Terriglobales bacterium]|nr:hypothetical protein [Terriglobales bacterium]
MGDDCLTPWWQYIGISAILGAGGKLLCVAAAGMTKHEDGGHVFAAVPLDRFTRILFAVLGMVLLCFGLLATVLKFGLIF